MNDSSGRPEPPALAVDDLRVRLGSNEILRGVSYAVRPGRIAALLGRSGSGKTTLLRCVAGLETPTAGSIAIGETQVFDAGRGIDVPTERRNLGLVFQSYALWPHKTVFDNVAYGLRVRGAARADIEARVAEVLQGVGLGALGARFPHQLSGGQQQRVALARAFAYGPPVILLDEPLSNLDAKLRTELRAELKRLHGRLRTTMVYVTHDQIEALTLGDRIAVMNRGRLQQVGTPNEIYRTPCNLFVALFVGSPAMNILPGPLVGRGADVTAGVRPEAMHRAGELPGGIPLELVAEVVEPLGSDVYVHGNAGGEAVVARLPGNVQVSPGDRLPLSVDPADLHLFDLETELRRE
ncbi:MAG: ABC transporter ATP-binding protein [Microvirga sp.]